MTFVEVNRSVCDGTRYCERVAPKAFRVDDEDKVVALISEIPLDLLESVREAESLCPTAAIRLRPQSHGDYRS